MQELSHPEQQEQQRHEGHQQGGEEQEGQQQQDELTCNQEEHQQMALLNQGEHGWPGVGEAREQGSTFTYPADGGTFDSTGRPFVGGETMDNLIRESVSSKMLNSSGVDLLDPSGHGDYE